MASKGKEKATPAKELFLTYTDLVKKEKSGERTQITESHSAWVDGIECIKAYHMQFTRLTPAQRDEMRAFIAGVHYAIPPSAERSPSSHKLYKPQQKLIEKTPESLSWPILSILRTICKDTLPTKYVNAIRETFGTSVVADHSEEYYRLEGTLPAGPVEVTGSKQTTTEKKASRQGRQRKRPASPTPPSRDERCESGHNWLFSRAAESILGNGSPATKDIARSLLQESQEGMGGRVGKAKKNAAARKKVGAKMYAAAEKIEAATKMILEAG
ncbi:hypothetical protein J3E68DRAFT_443440 [Trichoderma sp. SZMC 28012]